MRFVLALLLVLFASSASAQDIYFFDSYSTSDFGYGYRTETWGFGGRLGSPLEPIYGTTWTGPDYGYGRRSYGYSFGGGYGVSSTWPYRTSTSRRLWR